MNKFLLAVCMLCAAMPVFAEPPESVKAVYDVYQDTLRIGQIVETFSRNKNQYTITSVTRAVGLLAYFQRGKISINSAGLVTNTGLQPLHFSDVREGDGRKSHGAEFDWGKQQLTLTGQSQHDILTLPEGTQDRLSVMYQFMFLPLGSGKLSFNMTNGSKLDVYDYRIKQGEKLAIALGEFKVLYVSSVPGKDASRTEIWLAEDHHNFPYKMTITDKDGDKLTQVLTKIDFAP